MAPSAETIPSLPDGLHRRACSCRGLGGRREERRQERRQERREGGRKTPSRPSSNVQWVFISETHTPGVLSVSLAVCLTLFFAVFFFLLSFYLSFRLPFLYLFFLSVRVSACQSSVPSIWFLHDKNLSLKPDKPGPGYSEAASPAGWWGGGRIHWARWVIRSLRQNSAEVSLLCKKHATDEAPLLHPSTSRDNLEH